MRQSSRTMRTSSQLLGEPSMVGIPAAIARSASASVQPLASPGAGTQRPPSLTSMRYVGSVVVRSVVVMASPDVDIRSVDVLSLVADELEGHADAGWRLRFGPVGHLVARLVVVLSRLHGSGLTAARGGHVDRRQALAWVVVGCDLVGGHHHLLPSLVALSVPARM